MSSSDIPAKRLRPAIEVALRVAREGEEADPVEPAPGALRRYLSFARLPAPALEVARRVIDDDPDFRRRVVDATTIDDVGEAGWLWLNRPDGWQQRLGEVVGHAERRREDASAARAERSLRRRIVELEEAVRRGEAAAATDREQALAIRAELDAERAKRRAASRLAEERLASRSAAEAEVASLTDEVARLTGERDRAQARVSELEHQLVRLEGNAPPGDGGASDAAAGSSPHLDSTIVPGAHREAVARAIAAASAALAEASTLLGGNAATGGSVIAPHPGAGAASTSAPAGRPPPVRTSTRQPVKLPGGVFDDGPEAGEHLVRVPNVLLLVDGYNISNALAPGQPLKEQRSRLVDALSELQARTGTAVEVVFDGALGPDPWVSGGRPAVHVQFSPPGVEADDVLVDRIASLPAARPVILATSDRGLRDRARRHGANLLGARQLLAVMRR